MQTTTKKKAKRQASEGKLMATIYGILRAIFARVYAERVLIMADAYKKTIKNLSFYIQKKVYFGQT